MFKHKKNLGQNFLINKNITKKIAEIGIINKNSNILEVGPGTGVLTQELIKKEPRKIFAIEFDKDLKSDLERIKNNCNTHLGKDVISKIVNGKKTNYEIFTLLKICVALDVTPNEIIEKDDFILSQLKK